jgi:hypothetical protein
MRVRPLHLRVNLLGIRSMPYALAIPDRHSYTLVPWPVDSGHDLPHALPNSDRAA